LPARKGHPLDQAISREEEGILWRSLERIPETYREPLILFYREHRSMAQVALVLELSEEAVRQRLARGREFCTRRFCSFSIFSNTRRARIRTSRALPGRRKLLLSTWL
jgi:RNA polymerase sigma factor (sigma-70 family)